MMAALKKTNKMPDLNDYITCNEVAVLLGLHVTSVHKLIRKGALEYIKVGDQYLVLRSSAVEYKNFTKGMSKNDPRRKKQK